MYLVPTNPAGLFKNVYRIISSTINYEYIGLIRDNAQVDSSYPGIRVWRREPLSSTLSTTQPSIPGAVRIFHHVKPSAARGPSTTVTRSPSGRRVATAESRVGAVRTLSVSPSVVLMIAKPPTERNRPKTGVDGAMSA